MNPIRTPHGKTVLIGLGRRPSLSRMIAAFLKTLYQWHERRRSRHELRYLDDHLLKDIGLKRDAALREARRPFWKD